MAKVLARLLKFRVAKNRRSQKRAGSVAVEMALIAPVFFLFLMGSPKSR